MSDPSPSEVRSRLLDWYDANRRDLPWRRTRDPYRILIAEVLLQRTRIVSGTPYYERFLARFPTVRDLADASLDDVLAVWEGLGFYGRARNLHAAARAVVERFGGEIPRSFEALESLPGMGPYTAGAVASIAFSVPVPAVDGNVTRVIARLFRIREDVRKGSAVRRIAEIAARLVSPDRPGAFNQAVMELGATVCTPTSPACSRCPLEVLCLARAAGEERQLPVRASSRRSPTVPVAFGLVQSDDRVLLVRRPSGGLLAGLWAFPGGEVPPGGDPRKGLASLVEAQTGLRVRVHDEAARITHAFSHRRWSGPIYRCEIRADARPAEDARWMSRRDVRSVPMVSFHRKILESLEA